MSPQAAIPIAWRVILRVGSAYGPRACRAMPVRMTQRAWTSLVRTRAPDASQPRGVEFSRRPVAPIGVGTLVVRCCSARRSTAVISRPVIRSAHGPTKHHAPPTTRASAGRAISRSASVEVGWARDARRRPGARRTPRADRSPVTCRALRFAAPRSVKDRQAQSAGPMTTAGPVCAGARGASPRPAKHVPARSSALSRPNASPVTYAATLAVTAFRSVRASSARRPTLPTTPVSNATGSGLRVRRRPLPPDAVGSLRGGRTSPPSRCASPGRTPARMATRSPARTMTPAPVSGARAPGDPQRSSSTP
jgi:hypothetical protein